MKLDTAIGKLKRNYASVVKNKYIKDKVAWALFVTWQEAEKERSDKECRKETLKHD